MWKEKVIKSLHKIIPIILLLAAAVILLRLYELGIILHRLNDSMSSIQYELIGLVYDMIWTFNVTVPILIFYLLIATFAPRLAYFISSTLLVIFLLLSIVITQYFIVTLLPLSADLYGYTMNDIIITIKSSGENGWLVWGVILFIVGGFIATSILNFKQGWMQKESSAFSLAVLSILICSYLLPNHPRSERFDSDIDYYLATNKPWYLFDKTKDYWKERKESQTADLNSYPFLHKRDETDHLAQYFNKEKEYPNIVILIVEGLGRDFTGLGARYSGFTPFLDSLSLKSLYWENALSNAGRTFGALPSILGSLPYGREGFMSYGASMPDHQTLISLLKPYGYTSSFFYGGNPNFDNQDIFLEYQGIDHLIDEPKFPASYKKDSKVSSWGFSDSDVFSYASQLLSSIKTPRLDIFLTLSTHEPFISPDPSFTRQVENGIARISSEDYKQTVQNNKGVFSCLLYTDNAIRTLFKYYQSRPDFNNTIFIITGDHRLIPLPAENKIKRFHVPLIIYSPLVKRPESFSSLAIHSNITPSVINFLSAQYGFSFPKEVSFISGSLSPSFDFASDLDLAMIRNKNDIREYVQGDYFLSDDRLYKIFPGMDIKPVEDEPVKREMIEKLWKFKRNSAFACEYNRLDKFKSLARPLLFSFTTEEEKYLQKENIQKLNQDQRFFKARDRAFTKDYFSSKAIIKLILNQSPNYHDARILLARTYAWAGNYDSARIYIDQTIQRAPNYSDAYVALADMQFWQGKRDESWQAIERGLHGDSTNNELLARKARAFYLMGKYGDAKRIVLRVLKVDPKQELALNVKSKLK